CPRGARTAPAPDPARPAHGRLPHRGVIDPSVLGMGRRLYLVYKTQGVPSTIRIVLLHHRGLLAGRHSHELIRSRHIVENPVIQRRGHHYVLVTSEGSYKGCGYTTVWRRSRHLFRWSGARPHVLLRQRNTGICGPGGADVVRRRHGDLVFFHGWTCGSHPRACRSGGRGRRTMYAVSLVWHSGRPRLRPVHAHARHLHGKRLHARHLRPRRHHRVRLALRAWGRAAA
ncbi:MAG: hypothetical protein J2P38_10860, partial [Candidatus Dormibacteraeota bacterium]|nr:hypothetical protein [Candidatus Dormibacteraeota bacterium]